MLLVVCFLTNNSKLFSFDSTDLQQTLISVKSWMESYQLSLAPAKCQHLPTIHHHVADNASSQYYIGNPKISSLSAVRDLGVLFLVWGQRVCSTVSKPFVHLQQILHCYSSNNVWILLKAYTNYIRPLLEDNTEIWSSFLKITFL